MAVPEPEHLNSPFWGLLRDGRRSPYAGWFDVDWVAEDDRILMPVLGGTVEQVIERGELVLADDGGPTGSEHVLRYYDHEFPVAPGTEDLPAARGGRGPGLPALELARGRGRPQLPALLRRHLARRRPGRGPRRLHGHARDAAGAARPRRGRRLPDRPPRRPRRPRRVPRPARRRDRRGLGRRREDPRGGGVAARRLALLGHHRLRRDAAHPAGDDAPGPRGHARPDLGRGRSRPGLARAGRDRQQAAGRRRRPGRRGRPADAPGRAGCSPARTPQRCAVPWRRCSSRWTATAPMSCPAVPSSPSRRRSSTPPPTGPAASSPRATTRRSTSSSRWCSPATCPQAALDTQAVADEFRVRFQQTCGPVMAKGIEDTAFYRWFRLAGANEVGGDPEHLSIGVEQFHEWCARMQRELAGLDDLPHHPRHQALRGHPGPAHGPRRGRRGLGAVAAAGPRARRAVPHRAGRPGHRVPRLADPRRHLADHRVAPRGVPAQGGARGQGADGLGRRRQRLRGRGRARSPAPSAETTPSTSTSTPGPRRTTRRCGPTSSARSSSS